MQKENNIITINHKFEKSTENSAKITTKNKKDNIHEHHRERLFESAAKDFDSLSPIQQVEAMLFFIFPRIDTNPLAHTLLKKYGNYANILDADISDLLQVKGVGIKTANKIKALRNSITFFYRSKINKKLSLENEKEFLDVLEGNLRCETTENLYLFAMTNNLKVISSRRYDLKMVREVGIPVLEVYTFLASTNAAKLLVVHNHPGGSAMASDEDDNAVAFLETLLEDVECQFFDSVIVGDDGIFSKNHDAFVRRFDEESVFN